MTDRQEPTVNQSASQAPELVLRLPQAVLSQVLRMIPRVFANDANNHSANSRVESSPSLSESTAVNHGVPRTLMQFEASSTADVFERALTPVAPFHVFNLPINMRILPVPLVRPLPVIHSNATTTPASLDTTEQTTAEQATTQESGASSSSATNQGQELVLLYSLSFGDNNGLVPGLDGSVDESAFHDLLNRLVQQHQPQGPPPASQKAIECLPTVTVDEQMKCDAVRCSVCLEDFEVGNQVVKLPCQHYFDKECVESWLKQHNTCPVCRHQLPTQETEETEKSETISAPTLVPASAVPATETRSENQKQSVVPMDVDQLSQSSVVETPNVTPVEVCPVVVPPPVENSQRTTDQTAQDSTKSDEKQQSGFGGMKKGFLTSAKATRKLQRQKQAEQQVGDSKNFLNGIKRGFLQSSRRSGEQNKKMKVCCK